MKPIIPIVLITVLALSGLSAAELQVGILGGLRTVSDSDFSDVYGSGLALTPYAAFTLSEAFSLGASFRLGYSKDKPVGAFDDPSSFSMSALELFGRYRFAAGSVSPYLKAGIGLHFYSQTIEAAAVDFSESALGFDIGGGVLYDLSDAFSLVAELGYTLLSVDPLGTSVNLGGLRLQAGAAYTFSL